MNPTFTKYDHIGHGLDSAVFIGLGVAMIFFGLRRIRKKLQAGDLTAPEVKSRSKKTWIIGLLFVGFGIFRIFFG
jgi:hypothetical protein